MGAVLSCFTLTKRRTSQEIVTGEYPVSPSSGERTTAIIEYVLMNEKAHAPYVASENAAGMDLCAAEDSVIPSMDARLISTGLQMAIPYGYYGRVAPRSGLAVKHHLDCGAGVIDADYRGEIKVLLFNFGRSDFKVFTGDRIAQLICEKIGHPVPTMVKQLDTTKRGSAGFGSTGIRFSLCRQCVDSVMQSLIENLLMHTTLNRLQQMMDDYDKNLCKYMRTLPLLYNGVDVRFHGFTLRSAAEEKIKRNDPTTVQQFYEAQHGKPMTYPSLFCLVYITDKIEKYPLEYLFIKQ